MGRNPRDTFQLGSCLMRATLVAFYLLFLPLQPKNMYCTSKNDHVTLFNCWKFLSLKLFRDGGNEAAIVIFVLLKQALFYKLVKQALFDVNKTVLILPLIGNNQSPHKTLMPCLHLQV